MNPDEFGQLARDPGLVPGIFHYCDQWCERCAFTTQCLRFRIAESTGQIPTEAGGSPFHHELTAQMTASLEGPASLLQEIAVEEGELCDDLELASAMPGFRRVPDPDEVAFFVLGAIEYARRVDEWFEEAEPRIEARAHALAEARETGPSGKDPEDEACAIEDSVNYIRHDQHFLFFKLTRALTGVLDEEWADPPPLEEDQDGSARAALVSLDRSIKAWQRLMELFPDDEVVMLDILEHLETLRSGTEEAFPGARGFVRPGLDQVEG